MKICTLTLVLSMLNAIIFLIFMALGIHLAMTDGNWGAVIFPCCAIVYHINNMKRDRKNGFI